MSDIDAFLKKAQLLLQHRKPSEAEKQLSYVIRQEPDNTQALSLLCRCKYEQRKFAEGTEIIEKVIAITPNEDYNYYLLAFGHYQMNNYAKASENLHQAIKINPYVSDYFGLLSLIRLEEKNFKQALADADEGLAIDAENITCLNARSTALNKLKLTDDAIITMRSALEQDPENDFTHTTIGWNLLEKGRNKEAGVHFREALRINPTLEGARVGLKESLKSKILPYKWLLQYSFWISNRGRHLRWVIPIGLYVVVRLMAGVSASASGGFGTLGVIVLGLYILLVATSWIINPLANFFLLFDKDGKYALTSNERINSILLVSAVIISVTLLMASFFEDSKAFAICGVLTLTLAVPLGHMQFPLRLTANSKLQWFSIALVLAGLICLLQVVLNGDLSSSLATVYGLAFIVYTWMHAFLGK